MKIRLIALLVAALLTPDWSGAQSTAPPAPAQTQESVQKMQQQMDQIVASKDPKVRQKLLEEHLETMQQAMKAMRGPADPATKAQGEHGGMAMRGSKSGGMAPADDMKVRQDAMEKRMDTMMMMMEQMMKRDQMQSAPMGHM